jgi:alkylation response protein AidB-like acyl-CoA dehydrogenase
VVDLSLTEEQHAVRKAFAAAFSKECTPARVREVESVGFDPQLWSVLHDMGAIDVGIPLADGGGGGGLVELALIAEEAGRVVAPIPLAEVAAAARLSAAVGDRKLMASILGGDRLVSLHTRPGPVGNQLLVDGGVVDVMLVLDGDHLDAVDRPADVQPVPNLGGLPFARWSGGAVRTMVSGPVAVSAFERACDEVRLLRAASLVGLAAESIQIGAAYARERSAFGALIGTYQAVAHPLADAVTANDGAQLLVRKAAWAMDEQLEMGSELAAMAFVFAAEVAYSASQHSLHIHGGYGFMEEYDIQLYYRRAKAWALAFADPSRELLTVADRRFGATV